MGALALVRGHSNVAGTAVAHKKDTVSARSEPASPAVANKDTVSELAKAAVANKEETVTSMTHATIGTPLGPFTVVGQGKTVYASGFTDDVNALIALIHPSLQGPLSDEPATDLEPAIDAVRAYFAGDLRAIDSVEVRQHAGGSFLGAAWETLRQVEPGDAVTYTEFAARTGRPAAVRAAAAACARNAPTLFVPCHRVVRTDGSLGGYRWGVDVKRRLLAHEQPAAPETHS
jgi:methylated-DNA-[protein]-cysteine S-methyltransferase